MKSEEYWSEIEVWFEEIQSTLKQHLRQTRREALHEPPKDTSYLVPYRKTDDQQMLGHCLDYSATLIPQLQKLIKKKANTIEFTKAWAHLNYCFGYLQSTMFSTGDDMSHARGSLKGAAAVSVEKQKEWVADRLLQRIDTGMARKKAEIEIAEVLNEFKRTSYPKDAPPEFYTSMLTDNGQLKSTYRNISISELRKCARKRSQA